MLERAQGAACEFAFEVGVTLVAGDEFALILLSEREPDRIIGFAEMIRIVAKQQDWILNGDRGIPQVGHPPGLVVVTLVGLESVLSPHCPT